MRLIKMVSVGKSSMGWDGKPFWGLVVQKGPWKSTPVDVARAKQKYTPSTTEIMTPYQIDASSALPEPSPYAKRSVVVGAVDMKRQGAKGTRKNKLMLGARTPIQTGHKMGGAPEEFVFVPPAEMPDLLEASDDDVEMVGPFVSEHRIESRDASVSTMAPQMKDTGISPMKIESQDASVQSSKPQLSTMRGEPVSFTPKPAKLSMARGRTIAIDPEIQDTIMAPVKQLSIARGGTVSIEPWLQLPTSEKFLKTIADYESKIAEARIEKMSRMAVDEPIVYEKPAGVSIGKGKKVAMSKEELGKEADIRGLPGPSKPNIENEFKRLGEQFKNVKTLDFETPTSKLAERRLRKKPTPLMAQKSKESKTKTIYQRVTKAAVAKLIKKFSPSELKARAEASKPDDPQYRINKAAWKQYYDSL